MMLGNSPPINSADRWREHLNTLRTTVALHAGQQTPSTATPAVALQTRRIVLDTLGCALAGRHAPQVQRLEEIMASGETGSFRFPGGKSLTTHCATQILAMAATWDEACEGHAMAHGRPGVALAAALWPLALHKGMTLSQLVDAFVLGYEVGARAGMWLRIKPGMHVDGNWPALGVAAGAARLMGLGAAGIEQAINIAACQLASSLYLPVAAGCTARNTYLAHSASLGLQAAMGSAAGIDAPMDALAHYADHYAQAAVLPMPQASTNLLLDAYLKPFAAVRHVHYGALAALRIRERLKGDTTGIERIVLSVYEEAIVYCGNRAPRAPIQAQFSLSFGAAAMLRFGVLDPSVYETTCFNDSELRRLESLVELQVDDGLSARGERGANLKVVHAQGDFQESVTSVSGDVSQPLDNKAVATKFQHYASRNVSKEKAALFCNTLLDAPDIALRELWQQLSPKALCQPEQSIAVPATTATFST